MFRLKMASRAETCRCKILKKKITKVVLNSINTSNSGSKHNRDALPLNNINVFPDVISCSDVGRYPRHWRDLLYQTPGMKKICNIKSGKAGSFETLGDICTP